LLIEPKNYIIELRVVMSPAEALFCNTCTRHFMLGRPVWWLWTDSVSS